MRSLLKSASHLVIAGLATGVVPVLAHAQVARVVAVTGQVAPGDPSPGTLANLTAVQLSPAGTVAVAAFGASPTQTFSRGLYAERAGTLQRVTDNTVLGASQTDLLPFAMNAQGDVLTRVVVPSPTGTQTGMRLALASGTNFDYARLGDPLPSYPDRAFSGLLIDPPSLYPPAVLHDNQLGFAYATVFPPISPSGNITAAIVAYSPQFNPRTLALRGSVSDMAVTTFDNINWPLDHNDSGRAVFVFDTRTGNGQLAFMYWNGTSMQRLLGIGDQVPGLNPARTVGSLVTARINDAGDIMLVLSDTTSVIHVLLGDAAGFAVVYSSQQTISAQRLSVRAFLSTSSSRFELANDGAAVILSLNTLYAPPATGSIGGTLFKASRSQPPRVLWSSLEPVRLSDGTLIRPLPISANSRVVTSPATDRIAWYAIRSGLPSSRDVLCTLNDHGDPVVLLEGNTQLQGPLGPITLTASLTPSASGVAMPTSINDSGQVAVLAALTGPPAANAAIVLTPQRFDCGDIDFNNDDVYPSDFDVIDFFNVLSGAPCPTLRCDTIDFNRNDVFPEEQDVIDFLNVLAGGGCS
ncbi:MAG: hypothetical protein ACK5ZG_00645 [Phycisphaerae bacterium]